MKKTMNRTLTEGTPWKGILSFMFPVFAGLLLQQLYNTVDTIIVGNFAGEASLAAVGACGVLTMAFLALANGFSAGACILAVAYIFAEPIVTAFGLGEEAVGYCTAHVRCVAVCLIPFASYFPMLGLFQGANDALYATFVATSALAIRVISTYALQRIPAIGYQMIWWNTLFGWGIGFIITWTHFFRGKWKKKRVL